MKRQCAAGCAICAAPPERGIMAPSCECKATGDKRIIMQVAEHLGLSQAAYSKYETGEGDVPAQTLTELARFFHTTTDYILGLSDER